MKLRITQKTGRKIREVIGRSISRQEMICLQNSIEDFPSFTSSIYKWAVEAKFGSYVGGQYVDDACKFLQSNPWTLYVGPRAHFKSMRFYAKNMWDLWRYRFLPAEDTPDLRITKDFRVFYGSYKKKLADQHIYQIKELVRASVMPTLGLVDEKDDAETIARWTWDKGRRNKHKYRIETFGMLEGIRGGHSERVYVDDPFKDPKSMAAPTGIYEINQLFVGTVMQIPVPAGELHVIGTPQTEIDFFFDSNVLTAFKRPDGSPAWRYEKAIMQRGEEQYALWPEMWSLDKLLQMRASRKVRMKGGLISLFEQEFMCQPRSGATSYFGDLKINHDANMSNMDWATRPFPRNWVYQGKHIIAGYDPGKKVHPAHLTVLQYQNRHYFQLLSKWFDHVDYTVPDSELGYSQFSYINECVSLFGIGDVYADNTHGELSQAEELLNSGDPYSTIYNLRPMTINTKTKVGIAIELDSALAAGRLHLVEDERQIRSLLAVQGDLSIIEGADHHGEAFTSLGLPIMSVEGTTGKMDMTLQAGMFLIQGR
jgi:hypothetical protein